MDITTIGSSGQISLGKEYAGRTVTVELVEDGVWIVKTARVIPESELWLHTQQASEALTRGIRWAETTPPKESKLEPLERKIRQRR